MEFAGLVHLMNQWIVFTNYIKTKYSKRSRLQCPGCLAHVPGHETSDASCWVREKLHQTNINVTRREVGALE